MPKNLRSLFDRVVVITLRERGDRWAQFMSGLPASWPFAPPLRFPALRPDSEEIPDWWTESSGAWGCFLSHRQVLRDAVRDGQESILVLEDDAIFVEEFSLRFREFLNALPEDWRVLYLGGQHLEWESGLPTKINSQVFRPYNVNRMHAYAIRTRSMMEQVLKHLDTIEPWEGRHHIDHRLGDLQKQTKSLGFYVPSRWLVGQQGSVSDITGEELGTRFFCDSIELVEPVVDLPLVAVLGPFRGGTSAVAGVLHHLGIPMQAIGHRSMDRDGMETFEHVGLNSLCRQSFDEPTLVEKLTSETRRRLFRIWSGQHCKQFRDVAKMVGAKSPHLCLMGSDILDTWRHPKFIVVDRPEEHVIQSLAKRNWGWSLEGCIHATRQLTQERELFLALYNPPHLRVSFPDLIEQPDEIIRLICDYLEYAPKPSQSQEAVASIKRKPGRS